MELYEYQDYLHSQGIKQLGAGCYGFVYQHPTHKNVVVKVWKSWDEGYEKWLGFCLKNQNNPLVPKIYHTSEHGDFNITMLEKLRPLQERHDWGSSWNKHLSKHFDYEECVKFEWVGELSAKDKYAKDVLKFFKKASGDFISLDLHNENVMWRGVGKNKQIVITDPLV